ncbi:cytochrome b-c1 complex subunit 7-like [Primulina tabacum]|uniref:cytochrome b-c1 complex subunit 7-like n=1 Tax=Primulina tabacum TaxID=48773 RepID=UPI003F5A539D
MLSALSKWLVDPRRNPLAAMHMKAISGRLRKYGLRYDDLYDPMYDLDIKEALNRLPREIVDARNQRLKRAIDLSLKHAELSEELQSMQTPYRSYLQEMLTIVKRERAEREALGGLPLYQRSLP